MYVYVCVRVRVRVCVCAYMCLHYMQTTTEQLILSFIYIQLKSFIYTLITQDVIRLSCFMTLSAAWLCVEC